MILSDAGLWHAGAWGRPFDPDARLYRTPVGTLLTDDSQLLLMDETGRPIIRLPRPEGTLIRVWPPAFAKDGACRTLNLDRLEWQHCTLATDRRPAPLPATLPPGEIWHQALRHWKLRHDQHWEAWLRRLHTARLLGPAGPWLLDGAVLLLAGMLLTGLILRQRARRPHRS